jgi:hypothetical protein
VTNQPDPPVRLHVPGQTGSGAPGIGLVKVIVVPGPDDGVTDAMTNMPWRLSTIQKVLKQAVHIGNIDRPVNGEL